MAYISRKGVCHAAECERPILARGYCSTHYERQRAHGSADGRLKSCEKCGIEYHPWGRQRWCSVCCPTEQARHRMRRYGMSQPEWEAMNARQGGICALCERPAVAIDHDPRSGLVRGLLCHFCNSRLHSFDHDPAWLEAAADYIRR